MAVAVAVAAADVTNPAVEQTAQLIAPASAYRKALFSPEGAWQSAVTHHKLPIAPILRSRPRHDPHRIAQHPTRRIGR